MKIYHLCISKYSWTPAQIQPRGQNQTWPNSTWTGVIVQALISLPHTLLMPKHTVHIYQKVVIGVEKQQLLRPYEIPQESRPRWQEEPGASGSIQTALNIQGGPTTFQVCEQTCGEPQKPSQDPPAKSWLLPSLETQLDCRKDRLSEEKDRKCRQERKS